jgi:hypothetical protein
VVADSRPRVPYVVSPSGDIAMVILDHGETPPSFITYQRADGRIVGAYLAKCGWTCCDTNTRCSLLALHDGPCVGTVGQ